LPKGERSFFRRIVESGNGIVALLNLAGELELLAEGFGALVVCSGGGIAEVGLGVA